MLIWCWTSYPHGYCGVVTSCNISEATWQVHMPHVHNSGQRMRASPWKQLLLCQTHDESLRPSLFGHLSVLIAMHFFECFVHTFMHHVYSCKRCNLSMFQHFQLRHSCGTFWIVFINTAYVEIFPWTIWFDCLQYMVRVLWKFCDILLSLSFAGAFRWSGWLSINSAVIVEQSEVRFKKVQLENKGFLRFEKEMVSLFVQ